MLYTKVDEGTENKRTSGYIDRKSVPAFISKRWYNFKTFSAILNEIVSVIYSDDLTTTRFANRDDPTRN